MGAPNPRLELTCARFDLADFRFFAGPPLFTGTHTPADLRESANATHSDAALTVTSRWALLAPLSGLMQSHEANRGSTGGEHHATKQPELLTFRQVRGRVASGRHAGVRAEGWQNWRTPLVQ